MECEFVQTVAVYVAFRIFRSETMAGARTQVNGLVILGILSKRAVRLEEPFAQGI